MSSTKTRFVASTFAENPLPTSFSPPASCSGIYLTNNVYAIDNDAACLPPLFNGASTAFYSPGTSCPTGYTAQPQCSRNGGVRSVTTVTCCPHRGDITLSCVENDLTLAGVWETQFCTWMAGPATVVEYTYVSNETPRTYAATMKDRDGINAWGIRMVYQASDLVPKTTSVSETATAGGSVTAATAANTGGSSSNGTEGASSGNTSSSGGNDGLSTAVIVAVSIVVPVLVIAALAGLFFWWRKRKHRYAGVQQPTPGAPDADGQVPPEQQQYQQPYQYAAYPNNGAYQDGSYPQQQPAGEMAGGGVAGYYQNDKVLMNPGQQGQHMQFKGYPHPEATPVELPVGLGPAELAADGRR
ncbi:hypothetical protein CMUS01_06750 [Colletotrichum musicola]|uniref:Uncharacterized protein n=1 Tax=Colletotrichum musicola TaxID=2175873 RepID=A0A8H6NHB0_9PEZI|nr:hypothetical protein CMUS01_06750 [Colletotrichum musicola]